MTKAFGGFGEHDEYCSNPTGEQGPCEHNEHFLLQSHART